ncbi:hypothetical protein HYU13_01890 [Candidatus Woesearchaeota archaeon]|nr:hypothetical protein [Candidatus Woesearchaeota archaeon]
MGVVIDRKEICSVVDSLIRNPPYVSEVPARAIDAHLLKEELKPLIAKYSRLAGRGQKVSWPIHKLAYDYLESRGFKKVVSSWKMNHTPIPGRREELGVAGATFDFRTFYYLPSSSGW